MKPEAMEMLKGMIETEMNAVAACQKARDNNPLHEEDLVGLHGLIKAYENLVVNQRELIEFEARKQEILRETNKF